MDGVYERHPNLSVFHEDTSEVPFPSPSPPPSPSKRKGLLKRISTNPFAEHETGSQPSSLRIPIGLPKKVKSSIHSTSSGSEISLHRSPDTAFHPSEDTARPSTDSARPPNTPVTESRLGSLRAILKPGNSSGSESLQRSTDPTARPYEDLSRPSTDAAHPPLTPITESKFASIRSILKPGNTPGTGQSVRFFSRDAYKVITPDISSASEMEDPSIMNRLRRGPVGRPSAQEVFSPPQAPPTPISPTGAESLMLPVPPPELGNIFDLSSDKELPTIPATGGTSLLDSAIEISEAEDRGTDLAIDHSPEQPEHAITPFKDILQSNTGRSTPTHDRSQSFSFGQTVFHSLVAQSTPSDSVKDHGKPFNGNRNRALSDTVFHSMVQSPPSTATDSKQPEADINDTSTALVVMGSPEKEKDPFGAHATTYYTPGTMLPPSPPISTHTRKASREEDIIWSLRTQLALQSELCAQYELDLGARDELVQTLNARLTESERECERRKNVVRNWRKRVSELEKCVRGLEEEVDRSREESMERSVMDEASGEALRMLHRRIGDLEREKADTDRRENEMREELQVKLAELENVKNELKRRDQSERELKAGIRAAKEEMESMGGQRQSQAQSEEQQHELKTLLAKSEEHDAAVVAWEEERTALLAADDALRRDHLDLQQQLTDAREEIVRKEEEIAVLRSELEAQWKHTEKSGEQLEKLGRERDALKSEVDTLNERISSMELEWNENENRKAEVESELQEAWNAREELEREKEELESHLRSEEEHADELTRALQEREDRVTELTQERQYAMDSVNRLQESIRQRDTEIASYTSRIRERELEVEELHEEISRIKREHARTVDEQSRKISEVVAREVEARANMEHMLRGKAETDVMQDTLKDRVTSLQQEVEKLRRQVHELQQESADKEVKLAQLAKQRAQDKEDLQGLNIALDSKQQELELLKRRVATRGSANNTPATTSKAPFRRESSIFGTPSVSRPPSVLSDSGSITKERKLSDPPSAAGKTTLARSVRQNASASTVGSSTTQKRVEGSMGPPPLRRASSLAQSTTSSATPTRIPSTGSSTFTRSTSVTPTAKAVAARRGSMSHVPSRLKPGISSRESLKAHSVSSVSEEDEKENISTPVSKPQRRMVPA
ncbi:unnamed protein product [Somion occarium]|uniref:Uncharacterized protein n=1 Tax=Somion occarium TaxID=3059160 RepID=A0ABP1CVE7_9APHY